MFRIPLIKTPPEMPFPDPKTDPHFHDEMWVRYPMAKSIVPTHYADTITARRWLSDIKNDIIYQIRNRLESEGPPSLSTILHFKVRLANWFENLPPALQSRNIVFPAQLEVQ